VRGENHKYCNAVKESKGHISSMVRMGTGSNRYFCDLSASVSVTPGGFQAPSLTQTGSRAGSRHFSEENNSTFRGDLR
jgi:hypothetical protein